MWFFPGWVLCNWVVVVGLTIVYIITHPDEPKDTFWYWMLLFNFVMGVCGTMMFWFQIIHDIIMICWCKDELRTFVMSELVPMRNSFVIYVLCVIMFLLTGVSASLGQNWVLLAYTFPWCVSAFASWNPDWAHCRTNWRMNDENEDISIRYSQTHIERV
jgi:hypothetical protein